MPVTPEILIPLLGQVLVEQGNITKEQLQQALEYQKKQRLSGDSALIGQILVETGMLDQATLDRSITQQILVLQNNLRQANETLENKVKERTQELEIAYRKLSEVSQLKANFISNISHELRTPLTHLFGYVDLLLSDNVNPLTSGQKQSVDVIKRASIRLENLIDNLILFATSETNKLTIMKEVVDPAALFKEVIERNKEAAAKKNILLSENLEIEHTPLYFDREKIRWVLNQLVDNAIKFTNPKGKILLNLRENTEGYLFEVTDTGIGIPSDKFEEIFEQFTQLDGSSTRSQGGTGLGLALANNIIKAHNSRIVVKSILGKGSTFSFQLLKN